MVAPYIRKNHEEFNSRLDGRLSDFESSVVYHYDGDLMFGKTEISHTCLFEDDFATLNDLTTRYASYWYILYNKTVVIF